MVSVESARWGVFRGVLRPAGRRGISHTDEVDLRRRPLLKQGKRARKEDGVRDIPEVYVDIVRDLKNKGL